MTQLHTVIALWTAVLLAGCSSNKSKLRSYVANNPVAVQTLAAGDFLVSLHKQSLLPGDTKDMHGQVNSAQEPFPLSREVVYPFSRTFHVKYKRLNFTNNYTVVRVSDDSSWQLQRAWRTDTSGRIVEEWSVK